MTDVIARDDQIGTVICDAAHHEMHMRVVGVPMGDADPVQPGAEIALHLADQVAGEQSPGQPIAVHAEVGGFDVVRLRQRFGDRFLISRAVRLCIC
jgi:hypothetical protein